MEGVELVHKQSILTPEEQKSHINQMKVIAKEYLELLREEKQNYYKKENEVGYIISMDWLRKWEEMVYLNDFTYDRQPEFDSDVPT